MFLLLACFVGLLDVAKTASSKKYGEVLNEQETRLLSKINEAITGFREIRILQRERFFTVSF